MYRFLCWLALPGRPGLHTVFTGNAQNPQKVPKMGVPPFLTNFSGSLHKCTPHFRRFLKKVRFSPRWAIRRGEKPAFFPDEMSWTGSGKKFKRKFMVWGPVLAYFSYTNQGQCGPPALWSEYTGDWDHSAEGIHSRFTVSTEKCTYGTPLPYVSLGQFQPPM